MVIASIVTSFLIRFITEERPKFRGDVFLEGFNEGQIIFGTTLISVAVNLKLSIIQSSIYTYVIPMVSCIVIIIPNKSLVVINMIGMIQTVL